MAYPYASEIEIAASGARVDPALLAAIAWRESGFNPAAVGDGGCSCSMFQLNWCGGAGSGYSCDALQSDVALAAGLAAHYLASCLAAFPGDLYSGVAAYRQGIAGVRENGPVNLNGYITDILAKYQEYGGSGGDNGGGSQAADIQGLVLVGLAAGLALAILGV